MADNQWSVVSTAPVKPPEAPAKPAGSNPWAVVGQSKPGQANQQSQKTANVQPATPAAAQPAPDDGRPHYDQSKIKDTGAKISAFKPTWYSAILHTPYGAPMEARISHERQKEVFTSEEGAAGGARQARQTAQITGDKAAAFQRWVNHPIAALEELFAANPETKVEQMAKGGARVLSGMTSPTMVGMSALGEVAAVTRAATLAQSLHAVGLAMTPTMIEGAGDAYQKIEAAKKAGDTQAENEAWGELLTSVGMLVVPHVAGKAVDRFGPGSKALGEGAEKMYGKKFSALNDEQKSAVLFNIVSSADPNLKARVKREAEKLQRKHPVGKVAEEFEHELGEHAVATQAARKVVANVIQQKMAELAYQKSVAQQEARSRYEQEKAASGEGGTSLAERRGYEEVEGRHEMLGYQRQLDLERDHMRSAVMGKTQIPRDTEAFQQIEALNKTANELYQREYRGLAPQQKIEVLNRHLATADPGLKERVDTEMAEAAKAAPERQQIRTEVTGIAQADADRMAATRKVLADAQRQYVEERAKAGEGGESQASKRGFAVEDKRHIQLGNLRELYLEASEEAGGGSEPATAERPQEGGAEPYVRVSPVLAGIQMASREAIAADVRTEMNRPIIEEAQKEHSEGVQQAIDKAATAETRHGEDLTGKVQAAMEVAKSLGLDTFEQAVDFSLKMRENLGEPSDPKTQELLRRVRTAEIAGENAANRRLREEMVQAIYADPVEGREHAAREVARTQNRLQTVRQQIAITGDATEKARLQRLADYLRRRNDAIVAAARLTEHVEEKEAPRYKFGSTQANIPEKSEASNSIDAARSRISDSDLAGDGKDVGDGGNHVTVRYGIKSDDVEGIRGYLSQQEPFDATLGKTEKFPPSEHSDGAAVIVAPVEAPELHRINAELEKHGEFTEPSFAEYKPHATVAYVKPEAADRYVGMDVTSGKKFRIDKIVISDRYGNQETIKLQGHGGKLPARPRRATEPPKPVVLPAIPSVAGRAGRVVLNSGEEVPIHYAVVEADDLVTSHNPTTFEADERYPAEAQPRDYKADKTAQGRVHERAGKIDPDILLSDTVTPVDGSPIVLQNGVVMGGNGRLMSVKLAIRSGAYEGVRKALLDKALYFGIQPEEIAKMKHPVLVRVMDESVTDRGELTRYGYEFNQDPVGGISDEQRGATLARMMATDHIERLSGILESVSGEPTMRDAMRVRSREIGEFLRDAKLVDPTKTAEYFTSEGELNERSKDLLESIMAGQGVTRSAVLESANANVKDKLARAGMHFVRAKAAGGEWDLASFNTDAVALVTAAQDMSAALRRMEGREVTGDPTHGGESLVERFLHPERYRLSNLELGFDGQPMHPAVHPAVEALAMALEGSPKEYANTIGKYADAAREGGATMFGALHPADVFTDEIGNKFGLKVDPAEWGMVNGLPADAKVAIEEGRGPLPLTPEEGAQQTVEATEPDNSTVDDVIRGKEIKEVGDFRVGLLDHPNISVEQADAITQVFEHILPRAIGESFEDMLRNRRFVMKIGGEEGAQRGYTSMYEDGTKLLHLFESADTSSVMHEMFHVIREYINPGDQAILNGFVGAKAGAEWTVEQEEKAAQAFERYHYDGGRRRGLLDKVFAKINRAIQSVYNAVTSRNLATPSAEVKAMFDRWYDWERTERKPISKRVSVEDLEGYIKGDQEVPKGAKLVEREGVHYWDNPRTMPFVSKDEAMEMAKRNKLKTWELYKAPGDQEVYFLKFESKGKKLYQGPPEDMLSIAKRARDLEEVLKRTTDPREQARIRAALNALDDKLGGSTFVLGGEPKQGDNEARQLIYGLSEMPSTAAPTTPAQAATVRQVMGDPTAIELGGEYGHKADIRGVSDEGDRVKDEEGAKGVPKQPGPGDRGDEGAEPRTKRGGSTKRPEGNPLDDVKAAKILAPERKRGTPVVDPEIWKEHIEELGLPTGTPPPTIRVSQDVRDMMLYPGQSEAIDLALSGLQQHDAVIIASPTGSGKTYLATALADQLLGTSGEKVGLVVTRSKNLITELDGYRDVGAKMGVDIDVLPKTMDEVQTGVYAATYARIRGDEGLLTIPWDFVIFDESAEARRWSAGSQQGQAAMKLGHAAKKAIYMSATPFHTAVEIGYMHKLGLWPHGGFFGWARQFGVTEIAPNTYAGGYAPKKLVKLRQQLIERGQWITLHRDLEGVQAHVAMVEMTPQTRAGVRQIRSVFQQAQEIFRERGKSSLAMSAMAHEVIYLKRYIESARLEEAMDLTRKAIDAGWNPVIFSEYRSGTETGMEFFDKYLPPGIGKQLNAQLPKLPDITDAFRKKFGDEVAIFAGSASDLREEERQAYLRGDKRAAYATYAAGGVGVSFHDKVGDRPRMGVFLGLPWSGVMFEQSMGRTWRYGTESGVANVFLTSNALPELKVLATKILPRMRALNAAVYGHDVETSLAKALRESVGIPEEFIDYELGGDVNVQGSHFEIDGDTADFTRLRDLEMPDAEKAKNNGMKYKRPVKKLYQGPIDEGFRKGPIGAAPENITQAVNEIGKKFAESDPDENDGLIICTNSARMVAEKIGGKIVGYFSDDNPTAQLGESEGGHDFVIAGDHLVDVWAREVYGERAVYNLKDPSDAARVKELYGDQSKWEPFTEEKAKEVEPSENPVPLRKFYQGPVAQPWYYSQAERAMAENVPYASSGEQWQKMLEGRGVKPDEMKWTGLDDFLKGKKKVSADEVRDYLRNNRVEVKEKTLGVSDAEANVNQLLNQRQRADEQVEAQARALGFGDSAVGRLVSDIRRGQYSAERDDAETVKRQMVERGLWANDETVNNPSTLGLADAINRAAVIDAGINQAMARLNAEKAEGGAAKYESYTLPGEKENYRELLLTLPERPTTKVAPPEKVRHPDFPDMWAIRHADGRYEMAPNPRDDNRTGFSAWSDEYIDQGLRIIANREQESRGAFTAGHFGDVSPNVLAHIRFDDRVDADGKKVLFIEEIQSDWHQKGRKSGYQGELPKNVQGLRDKGWTVKEEEYDGSPVLRAYDPEGRAYGVSWLKGSRDEDGVLADVLDNPSRVRGDVVPDAPFKKDWHELAMKKMLHYASEHGYDRVAWTTGDQQNERYDLSKSIGRIAYEPRDDQHTALWIADKHGGELQSEINERVPNARWDDGEKATIVPNSALPDIIGKELADKVLSGEGRTIGQGPNIKEFAGLDLKIGGSGMKGFYDKLLPDFVNKYGKKWGVRTGKTNLGGKLDKSDLYIADGGGGYWGVYDSRDTDLYGGPPIKEFAIREEAQAYVDSLTVPDTQVHSVELSPSMKLSVLKERQRLFQGPIDPEDPFMKAAREGLERARKRIADRPVEVKRAVTANEGMIAAVAVDEARAASGPGSMPPPRGIEETPENAARRVASDMEDNAMIWWDDSKQTGRNLADFIKRTNWLFGTSGDRAVEKIARAAGHPEIGQEIKRMLIDYDIRSTLHTGELMNRVDEFLNKNKISGKEHEQISRIIEGAEPVPADNPRIATAVEEYRKFFADVRQKLADRNLAVRYVKGGKLEDAFYSDMQDDPNYWPRMYDWNKKFVLTDADGKKHVTSLSEIMNMPDGGERRERFIERFAKKMGITLTKAQLFFDKNRRGIRLAGNVERARENDIPGYGRDKQVIGRYARQVAEKLASAEVFGQDREKVEPLINQLRGSDYSEEARRMVSAIVTADLDPARLNDDNRTALRVAMLGEVVTKMATSALKVMFHFARVEAATNLQSTLRGMVAGAAHPREVYENARDAGALVDYVKQAWLREYGLHDTGLDKKLLQFNGFTFLLKVQRILGAGAGRAWVEKYAYPHLVKNPGDTVIRAKMKDLYGYNDEMIDKMIRDGVSTEDIRRVSLGAANWTVGSGRPSELPVALRGAAHETDHPVLQKFNTLTRMAWILHSYMFKTANLVNRTMFSEGYAGHKLRQVANAATTMGTFALAGAALQEIRHIQHLAQKSPEAEIEKRRMEWIEAHPVSAEALWWMMANISAGMAFEPLTQFSDMMATHDPKDKGKMQGQHRARNAMLELVYGPFFGDVGRFLDGVYDYAMTYADTGEHKKTDAERRQKIVTDTTKKIVPVVGRVLPTPQQQEPAPSASVRPRRHAVVRQHHKVARE